jgi:hypothetical protein
MFTMAPPVAHEVSELRSHAQHQSPKIDGENVIPRFQRNLVKRRYRVSQPGIVHR